VRAHEAALQLVAPLDGDVPDGQRAEAGGDSVVRFLVVGERLDELAACGDLGEHLRRQRDGYAAARDGDNLLAGERAGTDDKGSVCGHHAI
jgi:hypothetical protein